MEFIHPMYLPNTSFIKTKPKPIKKYIIEQMDNFMEHYNVSKYSFDKDFILWKNGYDNWNKDNYNPWLRTSQRIIDDMYYFDILSSNKKQDRLFKRKNPFDLKGNTLNKIKLFRERYFLNEKQFSNLFLGCNSALMYFRMGKVSLSLKTIDNMLLRMHNADMELINEMGEIYIDWERTKKH